MQPVRGLCIKVPYKSTFYVFIYSPKLLQRHYWYHLLAAARPKCSFAQTDNKHWSIYAHIHLRPYYKHGHRCCHTYSRRYEQIYKL